MSTYDEDLTNLDEWLRRLKVEYDVFFNGHRKKPPDDLKARVDRVAKRLAEATDMSFAQRFRYNTLVSRFYVYRDHWRRTLMEREMDIQEEALSALGKVVPESAKTDIAPAGIQVSIADPQLEEDKVKELYDSLLRIAGNQAKEQTRITFQQFSEYIARQTHTIRMKYGCTSVVFSIGTEENSIKFVAKAGSTS
jgi:hypothetical protein